MRGSAKPWRKPPGKGRPIIVVEHIPVFARTPEERDAHDNLPLKKRLELLALFEQRGVQLVLAGHAHRRLIGQFHGIRMVAGETTSVNFDFRPFGFRLWHIGVGQPWRNEFVVLRREGKRGE